VIAPRSAALAANSLDSEDVDHISSDSAQPDPRADRTSAQVRRPKSEGKVSPAIPKPRAKSLILLTHKWVHFWESKGLTAPFPTDHRDTSNPLVAGSSPARPTNFNLSPAQRARSSVGEHKLKMQAPLSLDHAARHAVQHHESVVAVLDVPSRDDEHGGVERTNRSTATSLKSHCMD
jgi:hypothetical protein